MMLGIGDASTLTVNPITPGMLPNMQANMAPCGPNTCRPGYTCADTPFGASCNPSTPIGQTNFQTDPLNCGSAGTVCPAGYSCVGGVCTAAGTTSTSIFGDMSTAEVILIAIGIIGLIWRSR
jgi:hypothetical protein